MKQPTKKTKKATSKRKVKATARRTSDDVSKLAAKWLRKIQQLRRDCGEMVEDWTLKIPLSELGALCGSLLAQDEVKGPRK
jgi:hypothetical protein